jgi:hypothetical protein
MYYEHEKIWHHYTNDILAHKAKDARWLDTWLQQQQYSRQYLRSLEVVDLHRYRLEKHPAKILDILRRTPSDKIFLFVLNKN